MKRYLFIALLAALAANNASAQDLKLPALSPNAKISQDFSTSNIEISYSRPSARGRKVFGDVVAYNTVWRTGANAATKVKFGEDVSLGGQVVKAGEYSIYTIPGQSEWEVIVNKGTGNWGTTGYDKNDDVARFKVKPQVNAENVQTFTIGIANITFKSCDIELTWEKTKVVIPVVAMNEERIKESIDKAINQPKIPYQQAASYYLETNQNLDKAYDYANKAIEQNPKAFWLYYMKARIAQKLGKKQEAIDAANKSIELAKGTGYDAEYLNNNTKIINALK